MAVSCPHCGQKTELSLPAAQSQNEAEAGPDGKTSAGWMIATVIILLVAASGSFFYWKRGKTESATARPRTNAIARAPAPVAPKPTFFFTNRLAIGTITLEKAKNSSVVYALGQIKNESDAQRFGLKVELDLLDGSGSKIGIATDYLAILEPRKDWHFRALVLETRAVTARLASIKEDQ
jgi:hypothetical protein